MGFSVLTLIGVFFEDAPMLVYQEVPVLVAIAAVGVFMYLQARRGQPKRLFDRRVEPLAANQVWAGVPLVVGVTIALALIPLPAGASATVITHAGPAELVPGRPLATPAGWDTTEQHTYDGMSRFYGQHAVLLRQQMTATTGDPRFDKDSRPRTVVVDSIVSQRPLSFDTFHGRIIYNMANARLSDPRRVDLGHGVSGDLLSVVDDNLLITWNSLRFAWGTDEEIAQRVTIFAVDNHEPDAPFPEPTTTLASTLRTMFTLLFRGNAVLDERTPSFKDAELLTEFGRELVATQFESVAVTR